MKQVLSIGLLSLMSVHMVSAQVRPSVPGQRPNETVVGGRVVERTLLGDTPPMPIEPIRVQLQVDPSLVQAKLEGRFFVVLAKGMSRRGEPRMSIGETGSDVPTIIAGDANISPEKLTGTLEARATVYPQLSMNEIRSGTYLAQAVFDHNKDLRLPNAPGNFFSKPVQVTIDRAVPTDIKLTLTEKVPDETLPKDSANVKWIKLKSELLSQFHRRPIYLRAGVVLPPSYEKEPNRRYPLLVHIGGFGTRYRAAQGMGRVNSSAAPDHQVIILQLDGAGPFGDCYQVNSDNNGPYGDALTRELIPLVDKNFRTIAKPGARFTHGASTGGWVSVALVLFYPEFFGGCYSQCPDSLDFRAVELINIYQDENAYVNSHGFERPAMRDRFGDTIFTVRNECYRENMMGRGNSFTMSGKDWGSWNATYSSRGPDGRPDPIWDPKTGKISKQVAEQWRRYDLSHFVKTNWRTLAPKIQGKLYIWVGDADDYFLNKGVALFKQMTQSLNPKFDGRIEIEPGQTHTSGGLRMNQILEEIHQKTKGL